MTKTIALKSGFSRHNANLLAQANKWFDVICNPVTAPAFQGWHFNMLNGTRKDSRDIVYEAGFRLAVWKWKEGYKSDAMVYLGISLHALQDKYAHRCMPIQHLFDNKWDDRWHWNKKWFQKAWKATEKALKRFQKAIKK